MTDTFSHGFSLKFDNSRKTVGWKMIVFFNLNEKKTSSTFEKVRQLRISKLTLFMDYIEEGRKGEIEDKCQKIKINCVKYPLSTFLDGIRKKGSFNFKSQPTSILFRHSSSPFLFVHKWIKTERILSSIQKKRRWRKKHREWDRKTIWNWNRFFLWKWKTIKDIKFCVFSFSGTWSWWNT